MFSANTSGPGAAKDPQFNYVTLLLHGDGTNGAQNNTIIDSSTNNLSATRGGNVTQGSFSPYGSNWSNYFDGTGDYLTTPSNAAFGFGTGDFTVEGWILGSGRFTFFGTGAVDGLLVNGGPGTTITCYDPSAGTLSGTYSPSAWTHVAVSRQSGTLRFFINGALQSSGTSSQNWPTQVIQIGYGGSSYGNFFTGYISNFRVVTGTAVYTANFTPSTSPLTAIAGTSLLTCQSNRFVDNSSNAFAITRSGDVRVQKLSPFSPAAAYLAPTDGASLYFDGSQDNLLYTNNAAFDVGAGNFTMEGWFYQTSNAGSQALMAKYGTSASLASFSIEIGGANFAAYMNWSGGVVVLPSASAPLNQWNHWVVQRNGANFESYLNGVRLGTIAAQTVRTTTVDFSVGTLGPTYTGTWSFFGYMSDVRIVKGTAVYSGTTYTMPTAPLSAITNTVFLLRGANAGIIDNAELIDLETVGNAQISTTQSKFGTGSLAFDGTGDWLVSRNNNGLYLGSGDFTIEGWLYLNATGAQKAIVSQFNAGGTGPGWSLYVKTTNVLEFIGGSSTVVLTGATTVAATTWTHFAVVRSGSTITLYINGVSDGTATNSSFADDTAALVYVGGRADSASMSLNGNIDDLRITKGFARYAANFTPPTAAFPDQ